MNKKKPQEDEKKIKKRLTELSLLIEKHNILYHQKDKPKITDAEFDALIIENNKLEKKYPKLEVEEIKELVVSDIWMVRLTESIQDELSQITQSLTGRITELAERYENPLPKINKEIEKLTTEVEQHLKDMGISWK